MDRRPAWPVGAADVADPAGRPNPISIFTGFVSGAVGWAWDKVVQGIFTWFAEGLLLLIEFVWGLLDTATTPRLTDDWFVNGTVAALAPIALFVTVATMLMTAIQAALSGRPELTVDSVGAAVRALAGTAFTLVVMDTMIRFADVIADTVWAQARPDARDMLDSMIDVVLGGSGWGATFLGPLALLIGMIGMVVTAVLLFTRSALLYFVAAFAPLVWSTSVLPMLRGGVRRLVQIAVALVLAKPAIVISLAIGMQLVAHAPEAGDESGSSVAQLGTLLIGFFAFAVASISPWVVYKLLPAAEAAAVGHGIVGGWGRSAMTAAQAAMMIKTAGAARAASAATKPVPVGGGDRNASSGFAPPPGAAAARRGRSGGAGQRRAVEAAASAGGDRPDRHGRLRRTRRPSPATSGRWDVPRRRRPRRRRRATGSRRDRTETAAPQGSAAARVVGAGADVAAGGDRQRTRRRAVATTGRWVMPERTPASSGESRRVTPRYSFGDSSRPGVVLGFPLRQVLPVGGRGAGGDGRVDDRAGAAGGGRPGGRVWWRRSGAGAAPRCTSSLAPGCRLAWRRGRSTWTRASLLAAGPRLRARPARGAARRGAAWRRRGRGRPARSAVVRDRAVGDGVGDDHGRRDGFPMRSLGEQDAMLADVGRGAGPVRPSPQPGVSDHLAGVVASQGGGQPPPAGRRRCTPSVTGRILTRRRSPTTTPCWTCSHRSPCRTR